MSTNLNYEFELPLLIYPDPRLQLVCDEIDMTDALQLQTTGVLLDEMWRTLDRHNGWGLAAPQIGSPTRAIVVHIKTQRGNGCSIEIVNPVLHPLKKHGQFISDEGCLSWPGKRMKVKRYRRVKVTGLDRWGDPVTFGGKDNQAAALQHEIEHLDGINLADYTD